MIPQLLKFALGIWTFKFFSTTIPSFFFLVAQKRELSISGDMIINAKEYVGL
jgi:hypothetical protein